VLAVRLKFRYHYDDALDVLAIHGVGGLIGMVLLGCFAERSVNAAGSNGLFFGGGGRLFGLELLAAAVTVGYSFIVTYGIAKVVDRFIGLRVSPEDESRGLDLSHHGESAYSSNA
jgi:Amt family ammonium transporter